MQDELRRWAIVGSGMAELARNRAENLIKEVVGDAGVGREGASTMVRDLLDRTKDDREELARAMKSEIHNQMVGLGVATSDDLDRLRNTVERLERRIASLQEQVDKTSTGRRSTTRGKAGRSSRTKTTKKTTVRRNAAGGAGSKKKTSAKTSSRSDGRKAAGRKAAGRKTSRSRSGGRPGASGGKASAG